MSTLQAVRNKLTSAQHWTRGAFARDDKGNERHPCDPKAIAFDIAGAWRNHYPAAVLPRALWEALKEKGYQFVEDFNDGANHADVLALLDRAIVIERGTS